MELRKLDRSAIKILPESIFMEGDTVLVQYIVTKWSLNSKNSSKSDGLCWKKLVDSFLLGNPDDGLEVTLVMQRRIMNELLTSYLPSILVLVIVYATNFFKPFFFEAIVATNLTSQLVLTTLFISVSKSLPPTAYVKMIDIWLIFSQLIPFIEVTKFEIIWFLFAFKI